MGFGLRKYGKRGDLRSFWLSMVIWSFEGLNRLEWQEMALNEATTRR